MYKLTPVAKAITIWATFTVCVLGYAMAKVPETQVSPEPVIVEVPAYWEQVSIPLKETRIESAYYEIISESITEAEIDMLASITYLEAGNQPIVSSNPCGEYLAGTVHGIDPRTNAPLNPEKYGGACNLGSIMLHRFVDHPFTASAVIDEVELKATVRTAVRMLDNIIDKNKFPDPIYENYQKAFRTIGLGVTGLADMLAMLCIRYDSPEGREIAERIMNLVALTAYQTSVSLAQEKGAFPMLDRQKFVNSGYLRSQCEYDEKWREVVKGILDYGIRNAKLLSVAPTGTMSLTFGNNCSSGIEPIFSLTYDRDVKIGGQNDDKVKRVSMEDYAYHIWSQTDVDSRCSDDVFSTALDMSVDAHLDILGCICRHVDMSVSKTINVPESYSFEQTKGIYDKAWSLGIKGCTIFRPNEIRKGILITDKETDSLPYRELGRGDVICCDDTLPGRKRKLITGCGAMHLQVYYDPETGDIMETFIDKGGDGGCERNQGAVSRLISLSLRGGVSLDDVIDQLMSVGTCPAYRTRGALRQDTSPGSSCPVAVGIALQSLQEEIWNDVLCDKEPVKEVPAIKALVSNKKANKKMNAECPECGGTLKTEGGCQTCSSCGWSRCGE